MGAMKPSVRWEIEGRPALGLLAGLVAGLGFLVTPWTLTFVLPFVCFRRLVLFCLLGLLLGLALAPRPVASLVSRGVLSSKVRVVGVPRTHLGNVEFDGEVEGHLLQVRIRGNREIAYGEVGQATGQLKALPDGTDVSARLAGIEGRLYVDQWTTQSPASYPMRLAGRWRGSFDRFVSRWLPPDVAAMVGALCLNLNGDLDRATQNQLRATGTIHLISVSGLHVFVVAVFLTGVLSVMPIPRPWQLALVTLALAFYALTTGLNPPVIRSVVMWVVGASAYFFRRDRDGISALALAAFGFLLWHPRGIFDIGFQLSFVTISGLILFGPTLSSSSDLPESAGSFLAQSLRSAVQVSAVAFLASAPLVASYFGSLPVMALPANLLVAGAASPVIVLGLVAHLLSLVWPAAGVGLLTFIVGPLAGWILVVVGWLGSLPFSTVALPAISPWWVGAIYLVMLTFWRERIVQP